jgi:hypothetical protein
LKTIGEVGAASAPELDALALLASENAETVVLDLVQPAGSGRRSIDQRGLAWSNEAGRRITSPAGILWVVTGVRS